jgi:hypothetical protein
VGFLVAAGAFAILLLRRSEQSPSDYQRLRWVIWGCLIGLPSLLVADLAQQTSLFADVWGALPEEAWDLVRLVNGVLCLFVSEAVRRPLVVSVAIPLRRVTILGLLLSLPTLLVHEQVQHLNEAIQESLTLPSWIWLAIASIVLYIISRLHELGVHLVNRYFNRAVAQASRDLSRAILQAQDFATIEAHLVNGVYNSLGLASAGVFRREGDVFRRSAHAGGWDEQLARMIKPDDQFQQRLQGLRPFDVGVDVAERNDFPGGLVRPVLAVPIANRFDNYAIALYGAHAAGNDLNDDERAALAALAELAGAVWTKLDHDLLRRRIAALEQELASIASKMMDNGRAERNERLP